MARYVSLRSLGGKGYNKEFFYEITGMGVNSLV